MMACAMFQSKSPLAMNSAGHYLPLVTTRVTVRYDRLTFTLMNMKWHQASHVEAVKAQDLEKAILRMALTLEKRQN